MELTNGQVPLIAVDRESFEQLVIDKHEARARAKEIADEWRHDAEMMRKDIDRLAAERDKLAGTAARDMPVKCEVKIGDYPRCQSDAVASAPVNGFLKDVCMDHLKVIVLGEQVPEMTTAFDQILLRLPPAKAEQALGYLGSFLGGPIPDDHALRPIYDCLKKALRGQRAGSGS